MVVRRGDIGNNLLTGNASDDTLLGFGGNDTLLGFRGDDLLDGGFGFDLMSGDVGDDTATYNFSLWRIDASLATGRVNFPELAMTDTLLGIENIIGALGSDRIAGDFRHNILAGNAGNDTLEGNSGDDTLLGEAGNDWLDGGFSLDFLDGGEGDDTASYDFFSGQINANLQTETVTFPGSPSRSEMLLRIENLIGARGDDQIIGNSQNNILAGNLGDDTLRGEAGNDGLDGGLGDDILEGSSGGDTLAGGAGNDRLDGGLGDDILEGNAGGDTLAGGAGNDRLDGGSDNDILEGNAGGDTLAGGAGNDTLDGGLDDDLLDGGFGNDRIEGNEGNDTLRGGDGNDRIFDGLGNDLIDGGSGNDDTVIYLQQSTVNLETGIATVTPSPGVPAQTDTLTGIENIVASNFGDRLIGDDRNNMISGFGGDDTIESHGGSDTLLGGPGQDFLDGGDGDDVLSGASFNFNPDGESEEIDTLIGGSGQDEFVLGQFFLAFYAENGQNDYALISDFNPDEDTIELHPGQSYNLRDVNVNSHEGAGIFLGEEELIGIVEGASAAELRIIQEDTLTSIGANALPVAEDDELTTDENISLVIPSSDLLSNDRDDDGDDLTLVEVKNAADGSAGLTRSGDVAFIPGEDFEGEATFDYVVGDGVGGTDTATVTVRVNPIDDEPMPENATLRTEGEMMSPDRDPLTNFEVGIDPLDASQLFENIVDEGENALADGIVVLAGMDAGTMVEIDRNSPDGGGGLPPLLTVENVPPEEFENPEIFIF